MICEFTQQLNNSVHPHLCLGYSDGHCMPRLYLPVKGHSRPVSIEKENPGYFPPAGFKECNFNVGNLALVVSIVNEVNIL